MYQSVCIQIELEKMGMGMNEVKYTYEDESEKWENKRMMKEVERKCFLCYATLKIHITYIEVGRSRKHSLAWDEEIIMLPYFNDL